MRSVKSYRLLALALAIVFSVGAIGNALSPLTVKAEGYNDPVVRVGLYTSVSVLDTRRFSSNFVSSNGFDIGYTDGENFTKIFSIDNNSVIILPQVNASIERDHCIRDNNGTIGSFSAVMGSHNSFDSAKAQGEFVAVTSGGFESRKYAAISAEKVKSLSSGRPVSSPVSGGFTVVDAGSGKIIFTFENTSKRFAVRAKNGGAVKVPITHYTGNENKFEYQGFFEITPSEGLLQIINCIGLEDYTKCVMSNEIGTNVSVETRKAFSVLARTVAIASKHGGRGFDVCNNEGCCQVYFGTYRMSEENNRIVDSTRGLVCRYNGSPINVLYHNSNGGASCSSVAAWGGTEVPYLTTVFQEELGGGDKWEKVYSQHEFYEYLSSRRAFSALSDDDISMKIIEKDPYGSDYITVLSVSDGSGNVIRVENSEAIRNACGFTSANFEVRYSVDMEIVTSDGTVEKRPVSGIMTSEGYKPLESFGDTIRTTAGIEITADKVVIKGQGVGHGVGFSATGSEKLAKDGYSYKYILTYFFKGISVEKV